MVKSIICDICGAQVAESDCICQVCGAELLVQENTETGALKEAIIQEFEEDMNNEEETESVDVCVVKTEPKKHESLKAVSIRPIGSRHQVSVTYNDGSSMVMKDGIAYKLYPYLEKGGEE